MPYREIMIIIGILTGLIVINKINSYFPNFIREKALHIKIGLSALIFFNAVNIMLPIIQVKSATFLSDIFFINLIYLAGSLFGAFLMINGFSEWIPSIHKYKKTEQRRYERLELFKKAEQYANRDNNFVNIADKTLSEIVELYELNHVELLAYHTKSESLNSISRAGSMTERYKYNTVTLDNTLHSLYGECHLTFEGISEQPDFILPVNVNQRPVAFICIWKNKDKYFSKKELADIKSLSIMLENKLDKAVGNEFKQIFRTGELSSSTLKPHLSGNTLEEKIQSIYDHVKSLMPLDYMSLLVKRVNENFHKYSVSKSGYVLKEVNADFFTVPGVSGYVYKNNLPVVIDDLGQETDFIVEPQVMKNDMRSMAVFPLDDNGSLIGIITFATKEASVYRGKSRIIIEKSLASFKDIIFDQQYQNDMAEQLDRLSKIENYALTADGNYEPQQMIKRAIDLLAEDIHPSMIRYSEYTEEEQFLYSHTLNTVIPYDQMMPNDGIMIKSLMPNHQIVIEQKKTLHINGTGNNGISEAEAVQIFGRKVSSMVIVPVIHKSKLYGLISMAELRNNDRYAFTFSDIKLTESISRILAQGLGRYELRKNIETASTNKPRFKIDGELRSSFTRIYNSVELLKGNDSKDQRTVEACISILDRTIKDINESLLQKTDYK
jgi:hypothetical protein